MTRLRFRKEWLLYGLAGMGISFATVTIAQSQPELERVAPRGPVNIAPYENTIAATAIVEPASDAIRIAPEIEGRVREVLVGAGEYVQKGDVLYHMEAPLLQAAVREAEAAVNRARAGVDLRQSQVAAARTSLEAARLATRQAGRTVERFRPLLPDGISPEEFDQLVTDADKAAFEEQGARDRLKTAELERAAVIADVKVAEATLVAAEARLSLATVRSPLDGQVLSVDLHPGEVVRLNQADDHAVTVGTVSTLHLRTEIDETEAVRFRQGQPAVAYLRGIQHEPLRLRFHSLDPILKKKSNFLSISSERLDSRVLEVTYVLDHPGALPVYAGQLVDVFINIGSEGDRLSQPVAEGDYYVSSSRIAAPAAQERPLSASATAYRETSAGEGRSRKTLRD